MPNGDDEATSTTTVSRTPRPSGPTPPPTWRGPRALPEARASGPEGTTGRIRIGPLAIIVSGTLRPATVSDGLWIQVTCARRAENKGAARPVANTAASSAPTAWTQPEPLEWATLDRATPVMMLPQTGPNHATAWTRRRSRCWVGKRRLARRDGRAMSVLGALKAGDRERWR